VLLDPLAPVTPNNLESLNYFTTGPRFTLKPTLRTTVTVDGTYSYLTSSSKSPQYVNIDNQRYAGDVTLDHAISNASSAYLSASGQKVDFVDQVTNTNFTQRQALAGFRLRDSRTVLDLAGGYSKLHVGEETPGGSIWQVTLSRQISPSQHVSLHALQVITDAANLFRLNLDQPVPGTAPYQFASGEPFTDREFGADWHVLAPRTTFHVGFLYISERYQLDPGANRDVKDANAYLARQLSPVLSWDIGVDYQHQTFERGGSADTVNATTDLRWQLGQRLALRFLYGYSRQTPNGYTENQVGVIASYALMPTGQSAQSSMEPGSPMIPGTLPGSTPQPHPL
jgi:hypothetical protein